MGYAPYRDLFTLLEEREDDGLKRTMWYCMAAATLYTRGRVNPLISELKRNENLRLVCHIPCVAKIPSRDAFKRFRGHLAEIYEDTLSYGNEMGNRRCGQKAE